MAKVRRNQICTSGDCGSQGSNRTPKEHTCHTHHTHARARAPAQQGASLQMPATLRAMTQTGFIHGEAPSCEWAPRRCLLSPGCLSVCTGGAAL